jgi:hypothetical protein
MSEEQQIKPVALNVSGKTLALITGGGLVGGALIVLGAIMPAEFNVDPLGLGKLTGIGRKSPSIQIRPLALSRETTPARRGLT